MKVEMSFCQPGLSNTYRLAPGRFRPDRLVRVQILQLRIPCGMNGQSMMLCRLMFVQMSHLPEEYRCFSPSTNVVRSAFVQIPIFPGSLGIDSIIQRLNPAAVIIQNAWRMHKAVHQWKFYRHLMRLNKRRILGLFFSKWRAMLRSKTFYRKHLLPRAWAAWQNFVFIRKALGKKSITGKVLRAWAAYARTRQAHRQKIKALTEKRQAHLIHVCLLLLYRWYKLRQYTRHHRLLQRPAFDGSVGQWTRYLETKHHLQMYRAKLTAYFETAFPVQMVMARLRHYAAYRRNKIQRMEWMRAVFVPYQHIRYAFAHWKAYHQQHMFLRIVGRRLFQRWRLFAQNLSRMSLVGEQIAEGHSRQQLALSLRNWGAYLHMRRLGHAAAFVRMNQARAKMLFFAFALQGNQLEMWATRCFLRWRELPKTPPQAPPRTSQTHELPKHTRTQRRLHTQGVWSLCSLVESPPPATTSDAPAHPDPPVGASRPPQRRQALERFVAMHQLGRQRAILKAAFATWRGNALAWDELARLELPPSQTMALHARSRMGTILLCPECGGRLHQLPNEVSAAGRSQFSALSNMPVATTAAALNFLDSGAYRDAMTPRTATVGPSRPVTPTSRVPSETHATTIPEGCSTHAGGGPGDTATVTTTTVVDPEELERIRMEALVRQTIGEANRTNPAPACMDWEPPYTVGTRDLQIRHHHCHHCHQQDHHHLIRDEPECGSVGDGDRRPCQRERDMAAWYLTLLSPMQPADQCSCGYKRRMPGPEGAAEVVECPTDRTLRARWLPLWRERGPPEAGQDSRPSLYRPGFESRYFLFWRRIVQLVLARAHTHHHLTLDTPEECAANQERHFRVTRATLLREGVNFRPSVAFNRYVALQQHRIRLRQLEVEAKLSNDTRHYLRFLSQKVAYQLHMVAPLLHTPHTACHDLLWAGIRRPPALATRHALICSRICRDANFLGDPQLNPAFTLTRHRAELSTYEPAAKYVVIPPPVKYDAQREAARYLRATIDGPPLPGFADPLLREMMRNPHEAPFEAGGGGEHSPDHDDTRGGGWVDVDCHARSPFAHLLAVCGGTPIWLLMVAAARLPRVLGQRTRLPETYEMAHPLLLQQRLSLLHIPSSSYSRGWGARSRPTSHVSRPASRGRGGSGSSPDGAALVKPGSAASSLFSESSEGMAAIFPATSGLTTPSEPRSQPATPPPPSPGDTDHEDKPQPQPGAMSTPPAPTDQAREKEKEKEKEKDGGLLSLAQIVASRAAEAGGAENMTVQFRPLHDRRRGSIASTLAPGSVNSGTATPAAAARSRRVRRWDTSEADLSVSSSASAKPIEPFLDMPVVKPVKPEIFEKLFVLGDQQPAWETMSPRTKTTYLTGIYERSLIALRAADGDFRERLKTVLEAEPPPPPTPPPPRRTASGDRLTRRGSFRAVAAVAGRVMRSGSRLHQAPPARQVAILATTNIISPAASPAPPAAPEQPPTPTAPRPTSAQSSSIRPPPSPVVLPPAESPVPPALDAPPLVVAPGHAMVATTATFPGPPSPSIPAADMTATATAWAHGETTANDETLALANHPAAQGLAAPDAAAAAPASSGGGDDGGAAPAELLGVPPSSRVPSSYGAGGGPTSARSSSPGPSQLSSSGQPQSRSPSPPPRTGSVGNAMLTIVPIARKKHGDGGGGGGGGSRRGRVGLPRPVPSRGSPTPPAAPQTAAAPRRAAEASPRSTLTTPPPTPPALVAAFSNYLLGPDRNGLGSAGSAGGLVKVGSTGQLDEIDAFLRLKAEEATLDAARVASRQAAQAAQATALAKAEAEVRSRHAARRASEIAWFKDTPSPPHLTFGLLPGGCGAGVCIRMTRCTSAPPATMGHFGELLDDLKRTSVRLPDLMMARYRLRHSERVAAPPSRLAGSIRRTRSAPPRRAAPEGWAQAAALKTGLTAARVVTGEKTGAGAAQPRLAGDCLTDSERFEAAWAGRLRVWLMKLAQSPPVAGTGRHHGDSARRFHQDLLRENVFVPLTIRSAATRSSGPAATAAAVTGGRLAPSATDTSGVIVLASSRQSTADTGDEDGTSLASTSLPIPPPAGGLPKAPPPPALPPDSPRSQSAPMSPTSPRSREEPTAAAERVEMAFGDGGGIAGPPAVPTPSSSSGLGAPPTPAPSPSRSPSPSRRPPRGAGSARQGMPPATGVPLPATIRDLTQSLPLPVMEVPLVPAPVNPNPVSLPFVQQFHGPVPLFPSLAHPRSAAPLARVKQAIRDEFTTGAIPVPPPPLATAAPPTPPGERHHHHHHQAAPLWLKQSTAEPPAGLFDILLPPPPGATPMARARSAAAQLQQQTRSAVVRVRVAPPRRRVIWGEDGDPAGNEVVTTTLAAAAPPPPSAPAPVVPARPQAPHQPASLAQTLTEKGLLAEATRPEPKGASGGGRHVAVHLPPDLSVAPAVLMAPPQARRPAGPPAAVPGPARPKAADVSQPPDLQQPGPVPPHAPPGVSPPRARSPEPQGLAISPSQLSLSPFPALASPTGRPGSSLSAPQSEEGEPPSPVPSSTMSSVRLMTPPSRPPTSGGLWAGAPPRADSASPSRTGSAGRNTVSQGSASSTATLISGVAAGPTIAGPTSLLRAVQTALRSSAGTLPASGAGLQPRPAPSSHHQPQPNRRVPAAPVAMVTPSSIPEDAGSSWPPLTLPPLGPEPPPPPPASPSLHGSDSCASTSLSALWRELPTPSSGRSVDDWGHVWDDRRRLADVRAVTAGASALEARPQSGVRLRHQQRLMQERGVAARRSLHQNEQFNTRMASPSGMREASAPGDQPAPDGHAAEHRAPHQPPRSQPQSPPPSPRSPAAAAAAPPPPSSPPRPPGSPSRQISSPFPPSSGSPSVSSPAPGGGACASPPLLGTAHALLEAKRRALLRAVLGRMPEPNEIGAEVVQDDEGDVIVVPQTLPSEPGTPTGDGPPPPLPETRPSPPPPQQALEEAAETNAALRALEMDHARRLEQISAALEELQLLGLRHASPVDLVRRRSRAGGIGEGPRAPGALVHGPAPTLARPLLLEGDLAALPAPGSPPPPQPAPRAGGAVSPLLGEAPGSPFAVTRSSFGSSLRLAARP
ncbi:hypothetical protein PAPYR_975 [Paratrimastix pyriformis]|uniref:Uncharacterized protein n=1 Tax=Paratrimastix pyriformis TaxID=342808 RepID=A0ABQ8UT92_9EUKA|nr:hypothetical protein PAPYR_975 [Paratrimastix pyriformis]